MCSVSTGLRFEAREGGGFASSRIERFFRTLREQFFAEAQRKEELSLPELNRLLRAWLERSYHPRAPPMRLYQC